MFAAVPKNSQKMLVPELPENDPRFVKNHGLPDDDNETFIPMNIIQVLGEGTQPKQDLRPSKYALSTSTGPVKKPASNVWSHKRRDKFKHLIDNTICKCGAGKDISFLYDVPLPKQTTEADDDDKSALRKDNTLHSQVIDLPKSIVPEEYHLVKNKGVLGLEFYDDKYTTNTKDHEDHLVVFPSMKPSSRYEVLKLQQSMAEMVAKLGINDQATEIKGPTQMHNLLELIKKEQNLYNIVFHELIRQCSVECVERGKLLSDLRGRYNTLLCKVPVQIRGLHNEVLAQRALDRRLTEELLRFKSTISLLTNELALVRAHDRKVTLEAEAAQKELKNALKEAARNAQLLEEYHDLYELQRHRLEKSMEVVSGEKEMWCAAAYSLTIKVAEETGLGSARKLHSIEKTWTKLANHFTILLSDHDTQTITQIQTNVDEFRNKVADFNVALLHREEKMRESIKKIADGVDNWLIEYKNNALDKTKSDIPPVERQKEMVEELQTWQECLSLCMALEKQTLATLAEDFVGDNTLSSEEILRQIRSCMENWTDNAKIIFNRHKKDDTDIDPNYQAVLDLNKDVEELHSQFYVRLTGENGVAKSVIFLSNMFETWQTKLNLSIWGSNPIPTNHWRALQSILDEWKKDIQALLSNIGRCAKDSESTEVKKMDTQETVRRVQQWATTSMTSIDSENAKLIEQVAALHNDMVHWMIQLLLRLAPNFEGNSDEINDVALLASDTVTNLTMKAGNLFERLTVFSKYVALCCSSIVKENVYVRQRQNNENADLEQKDLVRLRTECAEWTNTAKTLLIHLTGETNLVFPVFSSGEVFTDQTTRMDEDKQLTVAEVRDSQLSASITESKDSKPSDAVDTANINTDTAPEEKPVPQVAMATEKVVLEKTEDKPRTDQVEFLGFDDNTHKEIVSTEEPDLTKAEGVSWSLPSDRPGTSNTRRAYEALAALHLLQDKVVNAEQRAISLETQLAAAHAKMLEQAEEIRALKKSTTDERTFMSPVSTSNFDVTSSEETRTKTFVTQTDHDSKEKETSDSDTTKTAPAHLFAHSIPSKPDPWDLRSIKSSPAGPLIAARDDKSPQSSKSSKSKSTKKDSSKK